MPSREPDVGASPLALFGAELRHYRTEAGLSQEQLGEWIGYSAALVGAVETARRVATEIADHPDIVKVCAQVFDTLRAEALPPRASLDLIAEVRDTWT
jgi:transcriptional regulator with XRE-family HTH domain